MEETMLHMRTPKENVICYIELKEKLLDWKKR